MKKNGKNREIYLVKKVENELNESNFELRENTIPEISKGQLLVRTILISQDAANRAWLNTATYREKVIPGTLMPAYILGEVVQTCSDLFSEGDLVFADGSWADYVVVGEKQAFKTPVYPQLTHLLSIFGIAGKTAYHGLLKIGKPQQGETVVVSAAAGSVGIFVGQIAKIKGARTVGIAGGSEKCRWLIDKIGFDMAVDYKSPDFREKLKAACPNGIDVYFDNVAGSVTETALFMMNNFGRVVCCGAISQYESTDVPSPRGLPGLLIIKRLIMQGFVVTDYAKEDGQAVDDLLRWVKEGKIKIVEDIVEGLENAPSGLIGLLKGKNKGKRIIRVGEHP